MSLEGFLKTGNLVDFFSNTNSATTIAEERELVDIRNDVKNLNAQIEDLIAELQKKKEVAAKFIYDNRIPLLEFHNNVLSQIDTTLENVRLEFLEKVKLVEEFYKDAEKTSAEELLKQANEVHSKEVANWKNLKDRADKRVEQLTTLKGRIEAWFYSVKAKLDLQMSSRDKNIRLETQEIENRKEEFRSALDEMNTDNSAYIATSFSDEKIKLEGLFATWTINQGKSFQIEKDNWLQKANQEKLEFDTMKLRTQDYINKKTEALKNLLKEEKDAKTQYEKLYGETNDLYNNLKETSRSLKLAVDIKKLPKLTQSSII